MSDRMERFIAMAFNDWKKDQARQKRHPDEEEIACFLEGKLSAKDARRFKDHLAACDRCARLLAADLYSYPADQVEVPASCLEAARNMVDKEDHAPIFEIVLSIRDFGFEIIKTTGDVLFGQEFIPAAILRSRHLSDFKDEVVVVKDFPQARIEARIQVVPGQRFNLSVVVRDKKTQRPMEGLRVTLVQDNIELESRVVQEGRAAFEHVCAGSYSISISGLKHSVASISIDVRA